MDAQKCPDLRSDGGGAKWTPALVSARSSRAAVTYGILVCLLALAAVVAVGLRRDMPIVPAAAILGEVP